MNILVIGDEENWTECRQKFGENHGYKHKSAHVTPGEGADQSDVIFDFLTSSSTLPAEFYRSVRVPVFFNTAKVSLAQLHREIHRAPETSSFGFAGLPTFLNREILEVSLHGPDTESKLKDVCHQLGTVFQIVEDRVGLVTPRVICMIINEAYFTLQEGTASREDIDLAMKLGTHYPLGPFEWCQKIGIRHVYELLQAVRADRNDDRYKVCPLLEEESRVTKMVS